MADQIRMTLRTMDPDGQVVETAPFTLGDMKQATEQLRTGSDKMKPDPEFDAMRDNAYRVTADELRQFIERFERLDAEKKDLSALQKEVMAEAKGRGYVTKILRLIISQRKWTADDLAEEAAVLELYRSALGMDDPS